MPERVPYRVGDHTVMVTPEDRALLNDDYFIFGTSFVLCDGDGTARRLAPEDCFINPRKKENA